MLTNLLVIPKNTTFAGSGDSTQLTGTNQNGIPYEQGLPVGVCTELSIDATVTAGTVTFFVDRLGLDGVWYQILASGAISGASFSSSLSEHNSQTFGETARLRWTITGSATFSASVIGK